MMFEAILSQNVKELIYLEGSNGFEMKVYRPSHSLRFERELYISLRCLQPGRVVIPESKI